MDASTWGFPILYILSVRLINDEISTRRLSQAGDLRDDIHVLVFSDEAYRSML